jgi:hypothetical protein
MNRKSLGTDDILLGRVPPHYTFSMTREQMQDSFLRSSPYVYCTAWTIAGMTAKAFRNTLFLFKPVFHGKFLKINIKGGLGMFGLWGAAGTGVGIWFWNMNMRKLQASEKARDKTVMRLVNN